MLKNDTLKNGTSRIGSYGIPPPPPVINMQKLVHGAYLPVEILIHKRVKIDRSTKLLVFYPVELILLGNLHISLCMHARKKSEVNRKTASCSI